MSEGDEQRIALPSVDDLPGPTPEELHQVAIEDGEHAREEYWIATWIWKRARDVAWRFENTRVRGCLGMWWAQHVLAHAGGDDFRLIGAVPTCRDAYEALSSVMPPETRRGRV